MLALIPIAGHSQTAPQNQKATIVLVQGAWADASSFDAVVGQLQKAGYTVHSYGGAVIGVASVGNPNEMCRLRRQPPWRPNSVR